MLPFYKRTKGKFTKLKIMFTQIVVILSHYNVALLLL